MNDSNLVECGHLVIFKIHTDYPDTSNLASDISACVVNAILAILTSIGNASVIFAYHRNYGLQTKSNLLIVALALTDLLVGMLVQPLFIWVKVKEMMGIIDCKLEVISDLSTKFSCVVSLLTLGFIVTTERYIAVFHPIKHHSKLTKRKLFYSIIFTWVAAAAVVFSIPLGIPSTVYLSLGLLLIVITLTTSLLLYIKIAKKLRMMKSRVTPKVATSRGHRVSFATLNPSQVRAAVTVFYVLGSLFICWLPMFGGLLHVSIQGPNLVYQKFLWTWGLTCIYLNSFFNPFIYSLRNRNMSLAIRRLFVKDRDVRASIVAMSVGRQSCSITQADF